MPSAQWFDWVGQHWPLIGRVFTLLLVSIPTVWFLWQRHKREAREQEAQHRRLSTEADNLFGKARRSLVVRSSFKVIMDWDQEGMDYHEDVDLEREKAEEMLLAATEKYCEAIELTPHKQNRCELWVRVGQCYEKINWLHKAEQAYRNAVQNWSKHPEAWQRLAETQLGLLKDRDALHSLKMHLKINPTDKEAQWLLKQRQAMALNEPTRGGH